MTGFKKTKVWSWSEDIEIKKWENYIVSIYALIYALKF